MLRIHAVLTLIVMCLLTVGCKKEKSRICDLYDNEVGYAVGTIQSINTAPFKATYKYVFTVGVTEYEGKEKAYGIGQKNEALIDQQFIVIYASDDRTNSDLNLGYAMESAQDFVDFTSEFSAGPPPPDFPNKCN